MNLSDHKAGLALSVYLKYLIDKYGKYVGEEKDSYSLIS
jgi:hypothetical protein